MLNLKLRIFFTALCASIATILFFSTCKKEDNSPANCPDCPSITALTPNFGSPGDTITLSGKNFAGLQRVQFGAEEAEVLDGATATSIQVVAPDLNKTGAVDVLVVRNFQSPSGGTAVLSSEKVVFTYAPEKATIASLTPNTGSAGTLVTILGQRFDNLKAVRFNGVDATIQSQTPTQLTVLAPTVSVTGPVAVAVVTQFDLNGTLKENSSAPASFTYEGNFGILDFSPKIGKKDDLVTISGFGFGTNPAAIQVEFNGKAAEVVSVTDSEIKAKVPVRAGDGKIVIQKNSIKTGSFSIFHHIYSYNVSTVYTNIYGGKLLYYKGSNEIIYVERPYNDDFFLTRIIDGNIDLIPRPVGVGESSMIGGGIGIDGRYIIGGFNDNYEVRLTGNSFKKYFEITTPLFTSHLKIIDGSTMLYSGYSATAGSLGRYDFNSDSFFKYIDGGYNNPLTGPVPCGGFANIFDYNNDSIFFAYAELIRFVSNDNVFYLSGSINNKGYLDGPLNTALFSVINGLVYWDNNIIFVTDNNCIRKIDLNNQTVETVAGNIIVGNVNGNGLQARFAYPYGLAKDSEGNLLVMDSGNNAIRKITIE